MWRQCCQVDVVVFWKIIVQFGRRYSWDYVNTQTIRYNHDTLPYRIQVTLRLLIYSNLGWCYGLIRVLFLLIYSDLGWCYLFLLNKIFGNQDGVTCIRVLFLFIIWKKVWCYLYSGVTCNQHRRVRLLTFADFCTTNLPQEGSSTLAKLYF